MPAIFWSVKEHSYLGIILDQQITFTSLINCTVSKASKVLKFLKQNLHINAEHRQKPLPISVWSDPCWNMPAQYGIHTSTTKSILLIEYAVEQLAGHCVIMTDIVVYTHAASTQLEKPSTTTENC